MQYPDKDKAKELNSCAEHVLKSSDGTPDANAPGEGDAYNKSYHRGKDTNISERVNPHAYGKSKKGKASGMKGSSSSSSSY